MTQGTLVAAAPPPRDSVGAVAWMRANLFNTWYNSILTILFVALFAATVPPLIRWMFVDAVWSAPEGGSAACREAQGACWEFIREKYRLILFGRYPFDEQWRPLIGMGIMIGLLTWTLLPKSWGMNLVIAWIAGLIVIPILMFGGVLGLTYVPTDLWGGLPLTFGLSTIGLILSFPLSILLALGRRSNMPAIRSICVVYIELIRGVPLITVLFMASVMFPLFLPTGVNIDKLLRAQIAMILFSAAYLAEVIRGGLQAIPKGQYEAADSLGLGYWQKMRYIILPQALSISIPALVNTFISFFKDTSLVVIISLFDLLGAAKLALTDAEWRGFYKEAYLFTGVIFWVFCYTMSRYSQYLERTTQRGRAKR